MDPRDAFLADVAVRLPFAEDERREIVAELADHLADATAALAAEGLSDAAAARVALERLGSPGDLADALTRARRTPRRLLAAAGAGTWALATGGLSGLLVGLAVMAVAEIALLAASGLGSALLGQAGQLFTDAGWNSVLTLLGLGAAVHVAGRRLTPVLARRAGYRVAAVRRVVALVGGPVLAAYALVGWSGALNWPAVLVLLALPAWWVAGAWQGRDLEIRGRRRVVIGLGGVLVVALSLLLTVAVPGMGAVSSGAVPTIAPDLTSYARIAAPTPDAITTGSDASGSGGPTVGDPRTWVAVILRDRAALAGWRDLRIEAWRGVGAGERGGGPAVVDPAARGPFAVAAVRLGPPPVLPDGGFRFPPPDPGAPTAQWWPVDSLMVSGALRVDREPGLGWALVAITGIAPDRQRHFVTGPDTIQTVFHGTAWDWFVALAAGR
jgi:hypothetical protein